MIVAVKRNKKRYLSKILFLLVLIGISAAYYVHLEKKHQEEVKKELEVKQALKLQEEKEEKKERKEKEKKELESLLMAEIEKTVELIGQENIRNIKIIEEKVIIVCEPATNLDALIVRYGAMAFIKKTLNEIVIAVDLNFLLKSRLNAK